MSEVALSQSDHDLLIEIKTKLTGLTDEMRLMRDDTKEKVRDLETGKLDVSDFNEYKSIHSTETSKDAIILGNRLEKNEKKTELLLRNMYVLIGVLAVLEFFVPYVLKVIFGK